LRVSREMIWRDIKITIEHLFWICRKSTKASMINVAYRLFVAFTQVHYMDGFDQSGCRVSAFASDRGGKGRVGRGMEDTNLLHFVGFRSLNFHRS